MKLRLLKCASRCSLRKTIETELRRKIRCASDTRRLPELQEKRPTTRTSATLRELSVQAGMMVKKCTSGRTIELIWEPSKVR